MINHVLKMDKEELAKYGLTLIKTNGETIVPISHTTTPTQQKELATILALEAKVADLKAKLASITSKSQMDTQQFQNDIANLKATAADMKSKSINPESFHSLVNEFNTLEHSFKNLPTLLTEKDRDTLEANINGVQNALNERMTKLFNELKLTESDIKEKLANLKKPTWVKIQPRDARWGDRLKCRIGARIGEELFGVESTEDRYNQVYMNAEYIQVDTMSADVKEIDTAYIIVNNKQYSVDDAAIIEMWRWE